MVLGEGAPAHQARQNAWVAWTQVETAWAQDWDWGLVGQVPKPRVQKALAKAVMAEIFRKAMGVARTQLGTMVCGGLPSGGVGGAGAGVPSGRRCACGHR